MPISPITESHRYRGIPYCFSKLEFLAEYRMKTKKHPRFLPRRAAEMFVPKVRKSKSATHYKYVNARQTYSIVCCFALHDTQTRIDTGLSFESHVDKSRPIIIDSC